MTEPTTEVTSIAQRTTALPSYARLSDANNERLLNAAIA